MIIKRDKEIDAYVEALVRGLVDTEEIYLIGTEMQLLTNCGNSCLTKRACDNNYYSLGVRYIRPPCFSKRIAGIDLLAKEIKHQRLHPGTRSTDLRKSIGGLRRTHASFKPFVVAAKNWCRSIPMFKIG